MQSLQYRVSSPHCVLHGCGGRLEAAVTAGWWGETLSSLTQGNAVDGENTHDACFYLNLVICYVSHLRPVVRLAAGVAALAGVRAVGRVQGGNEAGQQGRGWSHPGDTGLRPTCTLP